MASREITTAAMFAALACAAAFIARMSPTVLVPFSLLPLIVFAAGMILTPRAAGMSMLVYVLLGLAGLPVFAKAPFGGPAYILQPTFGFIIAFPIASMCIALLVRRSDSIIRQVVALVTGVAIIYTIGAIYLYFVVNYYMNAPMSAMQVIKVAIAPFIAFDLAKAALALFIAKAISQRIRIPGYMEV